MNPTTARIVMSDAIKILDATPIRWWASSGTVLGAIREGLSDSWLSRDTDWDISIWGGRDEYNLLMEAFSPARGYAVHREYEIGGTPVQLCFSKDDVWVDFYFWNDSKSESDLLVCNCEHGQMIKLKRFGEQRYRHPSGLMMPGPVREYLFWRYGCEWHIPKSSKGAWELEAPHLRSKKHAIT